MYSTHVYKSVRRELRVLASADKHGPSEMGISAVQISIWRWPSSSGHEVADLDTSGELAALPLELDTQCALLDSVTGSNKALAN